MLEQRLLHSGHEEADGHVERVEHQAKVLLRDPSPVVVLHVPGRMEQISDLLDDFRVVADPGSPMIPILREFEASQ